MNVKLRNIYQAIAITSIFSFLVSITTQAQNCSQTLDFSFSPSSAGKGINWAQFPDFSLPFKVVYGSNGAYADVPKMLKSGFTHFSNPYNYGTSLNAANRAYIQTSLGSIAGNPQPWVLYKSPWGNDMTAYQNYWKSQISSSQTSTQSTSNINADIYVFDIELQLKSDDSILVLKNNAYTPANLKTLNNADFLTAYKKALQNLYAQATSYMIQNGHPVSSNIGSYGDAPILNTFVNIQGKTWTQWITDPTALNYNTLDFNTNKVGGTFYDNLSIITPSAYFYYDYPHPFAGEYLAYLLFQIEANKAWTNKDIMVFLWQKYAGNPDYVNKAIKPWMAESMAIFPFLAGAKGIWLWDDPNAVKSTDDLSNYEYFTKGLYRLSKFNDYFTGNFQLIQTISARDYDENKLPVWRGVYKNGKLFVAAHNPWALDENTKTTVNIVFNSLNTNLTLTGHEIYLCEYDLNLLPVELENNVRITVFPNPAIEFFNVEINTLSNGNSLLEFYDTNGKLIKTSNFEVKNNRISKVFRSSDFASSTLILKVSIGKEVYSKKIILQ